MILSWPTVDELTAPLHVDQFRATYGLTYPLRRREYSRQPPDSREGSASTFVTRLGSAVCDAVCLASGAMASGARWASGGKQPTSRFYSTSAVWRMRAATAAGGSCSATTTC